MAVPRYWQSKKRWSRRQAAANPVCVPTEKAKGLTRLSSQRWRSGALVSVDVSQDQWCGKERCKARHWIGGDHQEAEPGGEQQGHSSAAQRRLTGKT